ncbi:hypothetical protein KC353_g67 [Hortaea werneckii]|nr:hypothetical protein KC353_g67 [Hortaea werneckii]
MIFLSFFFLPILLCSWHASVARTNRVRNRARVADSGSAAPLPSVMRLHASSGLLNMADIAGSSCLSLRFLDAEPRMVTNLILDVICASKYTRQFFRGLFGNDRSKHGETAKNGENLYTLCSRENPKSPSTLRSSNPQDVRSHYIFQSSDSFNAGSDSPLPYVKAAMYASRSLMLISPPFPLLICTLTPHIFFENSYERFPVESWTRRRMLEEASLLRVAVAWEPLVCTWKNAPLFCTLVRIAMPSVGTSERLSLTRFKSAVSPASPMRLYLLPVACEAAACCPTCRTVSLDTAFAGVCIPPDVANKTASVSHRSSLTQILPVLTAFPEASKPVQLL